MGIADKEDAHNITKSGIKLRLALLAPEFWLLNPVRAHVSCGELSVQARFFISATRASRLQKQAGSDNGQLRLEMRRPRRVLSELRRISPGRRSPELTCAPQASLGPIGRSRLKRCGLRAERGEKRDNPPMDAKSKGAGTVVSRGQDGPDNGIATPLRECILAT
jgi:hypothetical protein